MELEHLPKELSCNSIRNILYGSSTEMCLELYDIGGNGQGGGCRERGVTLFWVA